ncbi:MAG: CcoQ/FixQ family Cbb3-type cytochrome c oxidase assembly chaperone [Flexibacter sp. CG_4_10_14_3_um_filter_32_15]|nr:MAG: CcoQ/FixQ family Cbb3-type cytochrome c oxidase assembly chaperone [Flexibacter sp. CG_4_10_14_3_um_filter_32_15]
MYKDVARAIDGIDIYPMIGVIIFFSVFMIMIINVYSAKKSNVAHWENLPLEDATDTTYSNSFTQNTIKNETEII